MRRSSPDRMRSRPVKGANRDLAKDRLPTESGRSGPDFIRWTGLPESARRQLREALGFDTPGPDDHKK